jgi:hypothetical protein
MSVAKRINSRRPNTAAMILERLIKPDEADFSPEAAHSILRMEFQAVDQERVNLLSSKAQEGTLTTRERAELEDYIRVADLLAMLQSKARLSLKNAGLPHGKS